MLLVTDSFPHSRGEHLFIVRVHHLGKLLNTWSVRGHGVETEYGWRMGRRDGAGCEKKILQWRNFYRRQMAKSGEGWLRWRPGVREVVARWKGLDAEDLLLVFDKASLRCYFVHLVPR
jgi:hypothetical protein